MVERRDDEADFTPLTPVMADEDSLDAPREALAKAEHALRLIEALLPIGRAALSDPEAALQEARRQRDEKQAAVRTVLDRMLNNPGEMA